MEALCYSETLFLFTPATRRHIPEESILNFCGREQFSQEISFFETTLNKIVLLLLRVNSLPRESDYLPVAQQ
jgi:hypothetical protein